MIDSTENISGVILAGGENKRFDGIIKSNIIIDGSTILKRITETISSIFSEIIVVTNTPEEFNICSTCRITGDYYKGIGPLGGIHAGMKASTKDAVFIFAGDMPFLDSSIIVKLIEEYQKLKPEILVPEINRLYEPLHAIYSNSLKDRLDDFLRSPARAGVIDFFEFARVASLQLPDTAGTKRAFMNINTPEDASEAEKKAN